MRCLWHYRLSVQTQTLQGWEIHMQYWRRGWNEVSKKSCLFLTIIPIWDSLYTFCSFVAVSRFTWQKFVWLSGSTRGERTHIERRHSKVWWHTSIMRIMDEICGIPMIYLTFTCSKALTLELRKLPFYSRCLLLMNMYYVCW